MYIKLRTAIKPILICCVLSSSVAFSSQRLLTVDENVKFDTYNTRLGGQASTVIYSIDPNKAWVVKEAEYQFAMGSDVFKFMLYPYINKYFGRDPHTEENPPYTEPVKTLVDRAKNVPAFRQVLDMPFRYTMIWAFPVMGLNDSYTGVYASKVTGLNLGDGYSKAEAEAEYQELYELTRYLMEKYQGTGRNFLIGNWEGDWVLLGGQGDLPENKGKKERQWEPSQQKIEAMRAWFANRQKAVEDARNSLPDIKGVNVYHYIEVNHFEGLVNDKKNMGKRRLVNEVLPYVKVDAVSYSAWSGTNKYEKLPQMLFDHLNYIEKNAKFTGYWPFEKAVFIGEYGISNSKNEGNIKVIKTASSWGCPFTLFWCIIPNYPENDHFMIDKNGDPTPPYFTNKEALAKAIAQRDIYRMYLRRNPKESELGELICNFQNVTVSSILSQTFDSEEFAKLIDNEHYLQALFQQVLLTKDYKTPMFSVLLSDLNENKRSRWNTLTYLVDSNECKKVLGEADFAKWFYSKMLQNPSAKSEDIQQIINRLKTQKRSVVWLEFLDSEESRDRGLKLRFEKMQGPPTDWSYANTITDDTYNHYTVDFRNSCPASNVTSCPAASPKNVTLSHPKTL